MQVVVIIAYVPGIAALYGIRRHFCPVKAALDINRPVNAGVHAHAQPGTVLSVVIVCHPHRGALHKRMIILPVRAVNHEGIRASAGDDSPFFAYQVPQLLSDLLQETVAIGLAVALIDHAEMIDIDYDGIHLRVPV